MEKSCSQFGIDFCVIGGNMMSEIVGAYFEVVSENDVYCCPAVRDVPLRPGDIGHDVVMMAEFLCGLAC